MSTQTKPDVAAIAAIAAEAAAQLAGVAWDEADGSGVLAAAVALGRLRAVIDGALVAVTERLEATGAADAAGWASTKDFLTHVLGGRKGAGGSVTRVAQQTAELPAVRTALTAGEISFAQAGTIGRRIGTLPRVPELCEQAADVMLRLVAEQQLDATDLDRCFPDVVRELDPDGSLLRADLDKDKAERGAHHARFLSFTPDTLGGVRIKGYATVEDAELVKTTLMPLAAPVTTEPRACGATPQGRDAEGADTATGAPIPPASTTARIPATTGFGCGTPWCRPAAASRPPTTYRSRTAPPLGSPSP